MSVFTAQSRFVAWLATSISVLKVCWASRRIRALVGVFALVIAVGWYWMSAASATLTIAGHHSFRQAEVSIWVDGDLKSTFETSGAVKKRFGVFQKAEGNFVRSMRVGSGDHTVRVRVHSLTDNSDIVRQCHASVEAGTESTVYVDAERSGLSLAFASAPPKAAPAPQSSGGYMSLLRSILMAIAGSALSATVGFLVQDFLKSRRAAVTSSAAPPPSAHETVA